MVINDLGKSKKVIDALKEKGIETVDHYLLLNYLLRFDMLPTLNEFSSESKKNLENVLTYGINVGQYIQGECVDYSLNEVLNQLHDELISVNNVYISELRPYFFRKIALHPYQMQSDVFTSYSSVSRSVFYEFFS